jgi:carboxymethylenebutenolidase
MPAPVDFAGDVRAPLLGLFGGADPSVPNEAIAEFDTALTAAGVEHRFVTFDGAPHSFFDRKFTEFAEQNAAAWQEVLSFVGRGERVPA